MSVCLFVRMYECLYECQKGQKIINLRCSFRVFRKRKTKKLLTLESTTKKAACAVYVGHRSIFCRLQQDVCLITSWQKRE